MNNWGSNDMLVKCSFRYCLNRKSYIVKSFIEWMKDNWESFLPLTKELIQKEIKESFHEGICEPEWANVLEWKVYYD